MRKKFHLTHKTYVCVLLLIFGSFFVFPYRTFAFSPTSTHPAITNDMLTFYNAAAEQKLSDAEREWILWGSRDETSPLDALTLLLGHAHDAYARGDREEAFTILGQILRIHEDLSLEDLPEDDRRAFEVWAEQFDLESSLPPASESPFALLWNKRLPLLRQRGAEVLTLFMRNAGRTQPLQEQHTQTLREKIRTIAREFLAFIQNVMHRVASPLLALGQQRAPREETPQTHAEEIQPSETDATKELSSPPVPQRILPPQPINTIFFPSAPTIFSTTDFSDLPPAPTVFDSTTPLPSPSPAEILTQEEPPQPVEMPPLPTPSPLPPIAPEPPPLPPPAREPIPLFFSRPRLPAILSPEPGPQPESPPAPEPPPPTPPANEPPTAITNLTIVTAMTTPTSLTLTWNAPADANTPLEQLLYNLRYATTAITNASQWETATEVTGVPVIATAGSEQTITVTGLTENTTYFFLLRTSDGEFLSDFSNAPSATTAANVPVLVIDIQTVAFAGGAATEYVDIVNLGTTSVSLENWTLEDAATSPHVYTFPVFSLAANATVRVYTGVGINTEQSLYWGRGTGVWNDGGDTAYLKNVSGTLIDSVTWE